MAATQRIPASFVHSGANAALDLTAFGRDGEVPKTLELRVTNARGVVTSLVDVSFRDLRSALAALAKGR